MRYNECIQLCFAKDAEKIMLKGHGNKELNNIYRMAVIIIIILLLYAVFYALGFRITYNPKIITNWEAVSAVGQWCSIAVSIFVVYLSRYLTKEFDEKTKDIASSNRASAELMSEIEKSIDEKVKKILETQGDKGTLDIDDEDVIKKRILSYIEISIIASTKKIADYIGKTIEETNAFLQRMENEEKSIVHIGEKSHLEINNMLWKSTEKV